MCSPRGPPSTCPLERGGPTTVAYQLPHLAQVPPGQVHGRPIDSLFGFLRRISAFPLSPFPHPSSVRLLLSPSSVIVLLLSPDSPFKADPFFLGRLLRRRRRPIARPEGASTGGIAPEEGRHRLCTMAGCFRIAVILVLFLFFPQGRPPRGEILSA